MGNLIAGLVIMLILFTLTFLAHFKNKPPEDKP